MYFSINSTFVFETWSLKTGSGASRKQRFTKHLLVAVDNVGFGVKGIWVCIFHDNSSNHYFWDLRTYYLINVGNANCQTHKARPQHANTRIGVFHHLLDPCRPCMKMPLLGLFLLPWGCWRVICRGKHLSRTWGATRHTC